MVKSHGITRREATRRAAVSLMRSLGYRDAEEADTVIWSSKAMALVHDGPRAASGRQVEWVFILAGRLGLQPVVISASGVSKAAVGVAERCAVATFIITGPETAAACDSLGRILLRNAERRAGERLRGSGLALAVTPCVL